MSRNYLGQIFKDRTGISISNYLNNLRIKEATRLLIDSTMKIYEISDAIGYSDQNYFSAIFKRYTGVSPREYRDLMQ